jgi:hypothetical protein
MKTHSSGMNRGVQGMRMGGDYPFHRVIEILRVPVEECVYLPEVGERVRECVGILPGYARVFSGDRGAAYRGGGAGLGEGSVHEVEIRALAKDMDALSR